MWFQKLSIPPPRKGFFLRPPPPPGNSSQASYIYLNFWAFENPPTPRNFQSLLWGEYGCFLELHNRMGKTLLLASVTLCGRNLYTHKNCVILSAGSALTFSCKSFKDENINMKAFFSSQELGFPWQQTIILHIQS